MTETKAKRAGRPKMLRRPTTINLSVDASVKRAIQKMAFDRRTSVSALLTEWVNERAPKPTEGSK